jgi:hypothetical protein
MPGAQELRGWLGAESWRCSGFPAIGVSRCGGSRGCASATRVPRFRLGFGARMRTSLPPFLPPRLRHGYHRKPTSSTRSLHSSALPSHDQVRLSIPIQSRILSAERARVPFDCWLPTFSQLIPRRGPAVQKPSDQLEGQSDQLKGQSGSDLPWLFEKVALPALAGPHKKRRDVASALPRSRGFWRRSSGALPGNRAGCRALAAPWRARAPGLASSPPSFGLLRSRLAGFNPLPPCSFPSRGPFPFLFTT